MVIITLVLTAVAGNAMVDGTRLNFLPEKFGRRDLFNKHQQQSLRTRGFDASIRPYCIQYAHLGTVSHALVAMCWPSLLLAARASLLERDRIGGALSPH